MLSISEIIHKIGGKMMEYMIELFISVAAMLVIGGVIIYQRTRNVRRKCTNVIDLATIQLMRRNKR